VFPQTKRYILSPCKPTKNLLFWYYIKQIMNVPSCNNGKNIFIRWKMNVPFNSAVASLNGTFHLSPHENILTIALINIHYLYNITYLLCSLNRHFNNWVRIWHHGKLLAAPTPYHKANLDFFGTGSHLLMWVACPELQ
jgi:hypothetical protein